MMAPSLRKRSAASTSSAHSAPALRDDIIPHTMEDSQDVRSSVGSPLEVRSSRGPTRGLNTMAMVRLKGRITITISPITNEQEGIYCKELISSCGTIVRTRAALGVVSWSKIPWDERVDLFKCLLEWFDLDLDKPHVLHYLNKIMGDRYADYRCKTLRKAYKKYSPSEARRHPPKDVKQEDWDKLCDIWENETHEKKCKTNAENRSKLPFNHRGGSKPFKVHRAQSSDSGEVQSFPDFFRSTHYNEKNGWISSEVQTAHEKMIELHQLSQTEGSQPISDEEMSQQVFGDKSRYYRGLAKRRRAHLNSQVPSSNEEVLRNELQTTQARLQTTEDDLKNTKNQLQNTQDQLQNTQDQLQSQQFKIDDLSKQLKNVTSFLTTLAPNQFGPSAS